MKWGNYESKEDVIDKAKLFIDQAVNMASISGDPELIREMFGHWGNLKRLFPTSEETYVGMRKSKYASALRILEYTSAKTVDE